MAGNGNGKPHTTATLQSVEITWKGKHGVKKMQVDLSKAGGIRWGNAEKIPWQGEKEVFPEAGPAIAKSAPVQTLMSTAEGDQALCWWDEVTQRWVCPEEPDVI